VITSEPIVKQLELLLRKYKRAKDLAEASESYWATKDLKAFLTLAQAAIERLAPPGSAYGANYREALKYDSHDTYRLECLMGIIEALRDDYKSGALVPIQELIRAEVFDDFLEMAHHLLEKGYKDPAAVLVGGVLEDQLRKLCLRVGIPIAGADGHPVKADTLNAALANKSVYNKLDQKSVTSWLDLRNKAAHGHYDTYTGEQVGVMLIGVRNFVSRMSAAAI
jgi:hypothetical protein